MRELTQKEKVFTSLKCIGKSARWLTTQMDTTYMFFHLAENSIISKEKWQQIEEIIGFEIRTGYEGLKNKKCLLANKLGALTYLNGITIKDLAVKVGKSDKDIYYKIKKNDFPLWLLIELFKNLNCKVEYGFKGYIIDESPMKEKLDVIFKENNVFGQDVAKTINMPQSTFSFKYRNNSFYLSDLDFIAKEFDKKFVIRIYYEDLKFEQ